MLLLLFKIKHVALINYDWLHMKLWGHLKLHRDRFACEILVYKKQSGVTKGFFGTES